MYSNTFKKGRLYKQCMVHQASLRQIFKKCHVFVYFLQAFAINPLLPSMTVIDSRLSFLADTATGLMFYDTKDVCATYQCTRKFNLGQGQYQCYQVNVRQRVSWYDREYHSTTENIIVRQRVSQCVREYHSGSESIIVRQRVSLCVREYHSAPESIIERMTNRLAGFFLSFIL